VNVDAKYVPVKSSARAVFASGPGQTSDIDVNPLIVGAGVQFQF
jgi:outer membrane protein W